MNARQMGTGPGIEESTNTEDLHHLRLMALPDELVREDPAGRSTARLYLDHRTLTARPGGRQVDPADGGTPGRYRAQAGQG